MASREIYRKGGSEKNDREHLPIYWENNSGLPDLPEGSWRPPNISDNPLTVAGVVDKGGDGEATLLGLGPWSPLQAK